MDKTLRAAVTAAGLVSAVLGTAGQTRADFLAIDFNGLSGSGDVPRGRSYLEDGFRLEAGPPNANGFRSVHGGSIRYTGDPSFYNNTPGGLTRLTSAGGSAFDLASIDLAELNRNAPGDTVTFTGIKRFGGTVSQTIMLGGGPISMQTVELTGFTGLDSVSWVQNVPYHQFDDLMVQTVTLAAPETLTPTAEFSVSETIIGTANHLSISSSTDAEVGNNLLPAVPATVRGMAEFRTDLSELTTATSAVLNFGALFAGIQSLGFAAPTPFNILVEAYQADGVASAEAYRRPALSTVGTFSTLGLAPGEAVQFDVTDLYNQAVANDIRLGFRLRQQTEYDASADFGYTFSDFRLDLDYTPVVDPSLSTVPEPTSISLLALGSIGLGLARFRRRRAAAEPDGGSRRAGA